MQNPLILRVDPTLKRQAWPWKDLSLGDVVHVYAPVRMHTKIYAAGSYRFARNPALRIMTKKHVDARGETYIRCEVIDHRIYEAQQAALARADEAKTAEEDARVQAVLARLRGDPG
jgi:hypothetical protein